MSHNSTDYIINPKVFQSPQSHWKVYTKHNTSESEMMVKFVDQCSDVYEQALGRLFDGGKSRFMQPGNRIAIVANGKEFVEHTDEIRTTLWDILNIDPKDYTVGEAVMFLYLYSKLKRHWTRKIDRCEDRDERKRFRAQRDADIEKIKQAVVEFRHRRDLLPTAEQRWWETIDRYFEKMMTMEHCEFVVEQALKQN